MFFSLHTWFGLVVGGFGFVVVGFGLDYYMCFGLQTHLVVASMRDDLFFDFLH